MLSIYDEKVQIITEALKENRLERTLMHECGHRYRILVHT